MDPDRPHNCPLSSRILRGHSPLVHYYMLTQGRDVEKLQPLTVDAFESPIHCNCRCRNPDRPSRTREGDEAYFPSISVRAVTSCKAVGRQAGRPKHGLPTLLSADRTLGIVEFRKLRVMWLGAIVGDIRIEL